MKYFILIICLLCFFSCSYRPSTKNDIYRDKAYLPKEERVHYKNSVEWWYITGHLQDIKTKKYYGIEYVFFHFNPLSMGDYLMGNLAITNPNDSSFFYDHVYYRQKKHLDTSAPLNLTINHKKRNWKFSGEEGNYSLIASMENHKGYGIKLNTTPIKPIALYRGVGYENYSDKGKAGYYSFPRLKTNGQLEIDGQLIDVEGTLWYDRQWNCGSVTETKVGWDWMSIQLENGEDLMTYRIFKKKKKEFIYSAALIEKDGSITHYDDDAIQLIPLDLWKSPTSKKEYPIKWKVIIPERNYEITVNATIPNQELKLSFYKAIKFYYWEGMCDVEAVLDGKETKGKAYLEMTNH